MTSIHFTPMREEHIFLWEKWIQIPHVKDVWFIEGYEPASYIHQKIAGNGYDYPFIFFLNNKPAGYIVCCDLYAYRNKCPRPKGNFIQEASGTFAMDLFIADENNLNKGYGTEIVKAFVYYIFEHFDAKKILIDPASTNLRAIRCYEKSDFKYVKEAFDGVTHCTILEIDKYSAPEILKQNILSIYEKKGHQWLETLPDFLSHCETEWQLKLMPCYDNVSFNYVAPVILSDQSLAVLKCAPANKEFQTEIAALQHFNGTGVVKLLRGNAAAGKMLLERIIPGDTLEKFNYTEKAVEISVDVMSKLHKPCANNECFPNLHDWFKGFEKLRATFQGGTGPFPARLIERAESVSHSLLNSMGEQILLHGDLHYGNILFSQERGWLAIDPKGVIGEREYEIPIPKLNEDFNQKQLETNLKHFLEVTGFDSQRIYGWLFAKAVLAAWWTYEDQNEVGGRFLRCAEMVQMLDGKYL